jgi:hypothetical protein
MRASDNGIFTVCEMPVSAQLGEPAAASGGEPRPREGSALAHRLIPRGPWMFRAALRACDLAPDRGLPLVPRYRCGLGSALRKGGLRGEAKAPVNGRFRTDVARPRDHRWSKTFACGGRDAREPRQATSPCTLFPAGGGAERQRPTAARKTQNPYDLSVFRKPAD